MGGTIGFHPNPNAHGSVFWFTAKVEKLCWPKLGDALAKELESTTLLPPLDLLAGVRGIAPGKRLLLAEDNFINRRVMLMMLEGLGCEKVDTVVDGAEAAHLTK